jgi:hypothetical protein
MQLHRQNAHVSAGSRLLRRTIPLAIATALVAIAGLTLAATLTASNGKGQTAPNGKGQTASNGKGQRECNVATLKGRYLFANSGTALPPAFGVTVPTPAADAGFHIFNGDGTGTDTVTVRIGTTVVLENFVTPFTYTVNADCTGSYTVPNGPAFGLFIAPSGEEFALIATDPPGNYPSNIHRRVARH